MRCPSQSKLTAHHRTRTLRGSECSVIDWSPAVRHLDIRHSPVRPGSSRMPNNWNSASLKRREQHYFPFIRGGKQQRDSRQELVEQDNWLKVCDQAGWLGQMTRLADRESSSTYNTVLLGCTFSPGLCCTAESKLISGARLARRMAAES